LAGFHADPTHLVAQTRAGSRGVKQATAIFWPIWTTRGDGKGRQRRRPRGAWKMGYDDFVGDMMAFVLLVWALNAASGDQRSV
jgi:hypothetical protein